MYCADCFEVMRELPDESADMILCDLPYGTTKLAWDIRLPIEPLWKEYLRIARQNAAVCLTAQQPFATDLINTSRRFFRYELIWEKPCALGFLNAKKMPLRSHEQVLVFYKRLPTYNPQMTPGKPYKGKTAHTRCSIYGGQKGGPARSSDGDRYPRSVLRFAKERHSGHPTEKPLHLFEWLVKTYTNEGGTVLDNCLGSGTTAITCETLGRRWIGIEKEPAYCEMAVKRLTELRAESDFLTGK